jgi:hypothetical protein
MNDTICLDDLDLDVEIKYTEEELEGMYQEYVERLYKKNIFKKWCKENLK